MREAKEPINKCPYCGSEDGFYTKQQARGQVIYYYNYDGSFHDNGQVHDNLSYNGGKVAYCASCNKKVFNMSKAE